MPGSSWRVSQWLGVAVAGLAEPVRVSFLGGLGEIGRNCALIEQEGRIVVLDCGIMFPDQDMPGIDLVLPDLSYLRERAADIEAVVLTHGHEDHVGGLAYLLRDLEATVYGSALTIGLARNRVDESGMLDRVRFVEVGDGERLDIGPFEVEAIPVTHSVPHGFAVAFHTAQGVLLHSGDFKLDLHPVDGRRTDLARMGELARRHGIRLLMSDSTNAEEAGFTPSESEVGVTLRRVFENHPDQRIVVTCFASHIHRVQQVVDAATATGRQVATLGRSMAKNVELARRLGVLRVPDWAIIDIEDVDEVADGAVCVVSTGSQGEPLSALSLMAAGENKHFSLREGDVVVISAHPIPGNEWAVGKVIDGLHRCGATVVHTGVEPVHVSGHARRGELETLLAVTRPEWFVPVHGEYRHLVNHARLAVSMGVAEANVLVCEDGDSLVIDDHGIARGDPVPAGYLYVDGTVGDVGHGVLRDRRVLAEEGVVVVVATVDVRRAEVASKPEIVTRGWVHASESDELIEEAAQVATAALEKVLAEGVTDLDAFRRQVRKDLGRLVNDRTRRRPMIVPVVVSV